MDLLKHWEKYMEIQCMRQKQSLYKSTILKVNIWCDWLYSLTQPRLFKVEMYSSHIALKLTHAYRCSRNQLLR